MHRMPWTRLGHIVEIYYGKYGPANEIRTFYSKRDYPSFVLTYFTPASARDAQLAIRGFNVELASVAEVASNPTIGRMRMKFWRESIELIYKVGEALDLRLEHATE